MAVTGWGWGWGLATSALSGALVSKPAAKCLAWQLPQANEPVPENESSLRPSLRPSLPVLGPSSSIPENPGKGGEGRGREGCRVEGSPGMGELCLHVTAGSGLA